MTERKVDRRIQRTRRRLSEALIDLIREKSYDEVTVQDILDRADVGRSTFYLHFRDKDALLASGVEKLREQLVDVQRAAAAATSEPAERAIAFSGFLFEHVSDHRGLYRGLGRLGGEIVSRGFRAMIKEAIDDAAASSGAKRAPAPVPADLLADVVASTFMILIEWWLGQRRPPSSVAVNDYFRALVLPTLRENT